MKALHGFRIVERRNGQRIEHYPKRTAKNMDVVKVRIQGLAHDIRFKHLAVREFEVWDGIDAKFIIAVKASGEMSARSYLLQPLNLKEAAAYERDYQNLVVNPRLNNQRTGRVAGDMTSWIKANPLDRVVCKMVDKSSWVGSSKIVSRKLGG